MKKLNKKAVAQIEALRLIDEKMNKEYVDFVSSSKLILKIFHFDVRFAIQEGSVMGNVFFEETAKLKKNEFNLALFCRSGRVHVYPIITHFC